MAKHPHLKRGCLEVCHMQAIVENKEIQSTTLTLVATSIPLVKKGQRLIKPVFHGGKHWELFTH